MIQNGKILKLKHVNWQKPVIFMLCILPWKIEFVDLLAQFDCLKWDPKIAIFYKTN